MVFKLIFQILFTPPFPLVLKGTWECTFFSWKHITESLKHAQKVQSFLENQKTSAHFLNKIR